MGSGAPPPAQLTDQGRGLFMFPRPARSNRRLLFELQPEREARSRNRRCGFCVTIARSKTDQAGEGCEITIPRGYRLRPVEAVQTWLAAAEISAGPGSGSIRPPTPATASARASLRVLQRQAP